MWKSDAWCLTAINLLQNPSIQEPGAGCPQGGVGGAELCICWTYRKPLIPGSSHPPPPPTGRWIAFFTQRLIGFIWRGLAWGTLELRTVGIAHGAILKRGIKGMSMHERVKLLAACPAWLWKSWQPALYILSKSPKDSSLGKRTNSKRKCKNTDICELLDKISR